MIIQSCSTSACSLDIFFRNSTYLFVYVVKHLFFLRAAHFAGFNGFYTLLLLDTHLFLSISGGNNRAENHFN